MKTFDTIKLLLLSVFLFHMPLSGWAKTFPGDDLKDKLIKEGQQQLIKVQTENALNDAAGRSERNRYLIIIGEGNAYPDGEFVAQRKGIGRGSDVDYLLDQQKIISIDNTLRTMNNASEIKTYVLIVRYMPIEFKNEISDGQDISDFFSNQKTDLAKAIAKPVADHAAEIVTGITSAALTQAANPTLYCGFINFKVFKNEFEGLSQWVYYPRNNNIKFDDEYKRMLSSSVSRAEWPKADIEKVDKLIEVINTNNGEYSRAKNLFSDLYAIDNPVTMELALKDASANVLSGFDIGLRLHILKVLSAGVTPGPREVLITNLINTVQDESDANQLVTGLRQENDKVILPSAMKGWCLLKCMTSQTSDGLISDNYKSLIKALVALCKKTKVFQDMVSALNDPDKDLIADRTICFNYNSFWSKMASTVSTFPRPLIDRNTDYTQECQLQTGTEMFLNYLYPDQELNNQTLDPLEPIVFVNQSDLGMLGGIDGSNIFVSPAIILKYADDKAWNQTATDVTMAAIDAASLATGYGEIKAGVTGLRKAWTLMDMANSGINLTLNATLATENATVKNILNLYNAVTGGVAITRMATGGIKSVYGLIKGKSVLGEKQILDFLKALDDGGDDALKDLSADDFSSIQAIVKRIESEAGIKNLSEIEQLAKKIADRMEGFRIAKGGGKLDKIVAALKADFPTTWKFNKVGDDAFEVFDGVGNKWGTVYIDKIVAPGRTAIGTLGNPILNKTTYVKNTKYDVDGIIYQIDDLGRVSVTNADLDNVVRVRLGNQQIKAVDVKDGVRGGDQGGHIVGSRFFGPGEQINLYPQSANLNQGAWKQMENAWADAMVNGSDVKIEVKAIFNGTSLRPDAFEVSYWIDGAKTQRTFINQ